MFVSIVKCMETLSGIGHELSKDKYLVFLLCMFVIAAYLKTKDPVMKDLASLVVGGFLALLRSSTPAQSPVVTSLEVK
jgi:hypothetical protein